MVNPTPTVQALWLRASPGAIPQAVDSLQLVAGAGVQGDHTFGKKRHITLVFEQDWGDACKELGHDVDPKGRRANVLLSGRGGLALIGQRLQIGEVQLIVQGETRPCAVMEQAATGLMAALEPAVRAGVWAQVVQGGTLQLGHALRVLA